MKPSSHGMPLGIGARPSMCMLVGCACKWRHITRSSMAQPRLPAAPSAGNQSGTPAAAPMACAQCVAGCTAGCTCTDHYRARTSCRVNAGQPKKWHSWLQQDAHACVGPLRTQSTEARKSCRAAGSRGPHTLICTGIERHISMAEPVMDRSQAQLRRRRGELLQASWSFNGRCRAVPLNLTRAAGW